jgi:proteasome lid subunit RPN8/RPN11
MTVKQVTSSVSVAFEDEAVANFFEDQVDCERRPEQFARIWLHTHPGNSPEPSMTDEATFTRVFGSCDWSVMCIVAQDGGTFARLQFNVGPGGEVKIPVYVDYVCEFEATNFELWKQQYKAGVIEDEIFKQTDKPKQPAVNPQKEVELFGNENFSKVPLFSSEDLISEIDQMDPMERDVFMEELAIRSDFWNEESEVFYG